MRLIYRIVPLILIALLALSPSLVAAENGRITGKVKNKSGDNLLDAIVSIFRQGDETINITSARTDERGYFRFGNLLPGDYSLQVVREGYRTDSLDVEIKPGQTTSIDVVLQNALNRLSNDQDPRNWDLKSVMRSTSDSRLIFRNLPGSSLPGSEEYGKSFSRSASMNIVSGAGLGGDNLSLLPGTGNNGVISTFAFAEPLGDNGRMIFSGQLNSGLDAFWRVRNTFDYKPNDSQDVRISLGYGRINLGHSSISSLIHPAQFFSQNASLRESPVETISLGFEATDRVTDAMTLDYGFDASQLNYGVSKRVISPFFELVFTPVESWVIKTSFASRHSSDENSVVLADGEVLDLSEPTYLTNIDGEISLSQLKHSEISLGKDLGNDTFVAAAIYNDRMIGAGYPFMVTTEMNNGEQETNIKQLAEMQSGQHGVRLVLSRKMMDFLDSSIAYAYGTGTGLSFDENTASSEDLTRDLLEYMRQSYYHAISGRVAATLPVTKTHLAAIIRWVPNNPITPIDPFADRKGLMTKGFSFSVRQPIPMPGFMEGTSRWEALIDVRNVFDTGQAVAQTSDGLVILSRYPRSIRFGIDLNFY
jgi:hypothetical protein